ncbi:hypothetical protein GCM10010191_90120 [Actinomadura vinacea]|uniref:Uncharacterized protein n=1 Tax=Actinomadura vinacea TaxID=115336 RepID=A0ABN3KDF8_9ACTN
MTGPSGAPDDGRPVTDAIREEFPGVWAWYGHATGSWWAMVPLRCGPRLVEALNPRELRDAIENAANWPWPKNGSSLRA